MIFNVPFLLTFLAGYAPLVPGDLIFTGTPAGVGPMRQGDEFSMAWGAGGPAGGPFAGTL